MIVAVCIRFLGQTGAKVATLLLLLLVLCGEARKAAGRGSGEATAGRSRNRARGIIGGRGGSTSARSSPRIVFGVIGTSPRRGGVVTGRKWACAVERHSVGDGRGSTARSRDFESQGEEGVMVDGGEGKGR